MITNSRLLRPVPADYLAFTPLTPRVPQPDMTKRDYDAAET
jgi:hypothetical protein